MDEKSSNINRLFYLFSFLMVLVYWAAGFTLLFLNFFPEMSKQTRFMFGLLLLLYGTYRGLMLFTKYRREKRNNRANVLAILLLIATMSGCNSAPKHEPYTDTPTSGEILILADESYQPIVQAQLDTFMKIYKYAKINVRYMPENEIFNQLLNNDTVRIAIVARELTPDEKTHFDNQKIIPRTLKVASDALALVVNKSNADTAITYEQFSEIMNGEISRWEQLNAGGMKDSIVIVFDKNGSANFSYLSQKFLGKKPFPKNTFATNSNESVVKYVSEANNALGVVSVNWISDTDDSLANNFLSNVNVIAMSMPDTSSAEREFNKPLQAYIALKKYPLLRDMLIISREGRNGLGTGFASFVAGDKGQRMIRLQGLLPATMPVRIIQVN